MDAVQKGLTRFLLWAVFFIGFCGSVQAASITTTFAGGNGQPDGNMFDVTTFTNSLTVTALDVHFATTTAFNLNVYTKSGTYVGSQTNSGAWTLAATGSATGAGSGTPTFVDITDFVLPANSLTGFYVDLDVDGIIYTDGFNTFSNADIQLDLGAGILGDFGSINVFSPRTWNGTIYYDVNSVPVPTTLLLIGFGLASFGLASRTKSK